MSRILILHFCGLSFTILFVLKFYFRSPGQGRTVKRVIICTYFQASVMRETNAIFLLVHILLIYGSKSIAAMIDYCKNHTMDKPTNSEVLHFSKENSDREFGIYEKFKCLHCCSHGYRSIEWFKDGQPYPWPTDVSSLIIHPESGNQTICSQRSTADDSGRYWCIASNDTHFLQHEVVLQISGPSISMGWPKTTYKPRDQKANHGESVRFYCEAFVGTIDLPDFHSEITWERYDQNKSFINGDRIFQEVVFREEKRVLGSYLYFKEVRLEDYGEYTCKVKNLGDQVVQLSAWLRNRGQQAGFLPFPNNERFRSTSSLFIYLILVALLLTVVSVFKLLSSYQILRKRLPTTFAPLPSLMDDTRKDLLVIYNKNDFKEILKVMPKLQGRYLYSYTLHPVDSTTQLGEEDLKAKANSYRAVLALISPALLGGVWACDSIANGLQALLNIHFTVICILLKSLPEMEANSGEAQLLMEKLSRVHYVDNNKGKNTKFWNLVKLKLSFQRRGSICGGSSQALI